MEYIIFPVEELDKVSKERLDELHLVPRKSVDGKQVVMKVANYDKLFPKEFMPLSINLDNDGNEVEAITYPYDTYSSEEISKVLTSDIWSAPDDTIVLSPVKE